MTDAIASRMAERWSPGRLATGMAIVAVCVPMALDRLAPPVRGECGTTLTNLAFVIGLGYLGARLAWLPLKASNDATERWLAAREARMSSQHPTLDPTGHPSTP